MSVNIEEQHVLNKIGLYTCTLSLFTVSLISICCLG